MSSKSVTTAYSLFSAAYRRQAHRYKDPRSFRMAVDIQWRRLSNEDRQRWIKFSNPENKQSNTTDTQKPQSWNQ
jgi:hypothetical protein